MSRKVKPLDVLKYGEDVAQLKASMPRRRWRRFVKYAHSRGNTVAGQLSGAPGPLKQKTPTHLRKQATRTIGRAFKPVYQELDSREAAVKALAEKRASDDAAYRQWLMGEVGKLDAQARAADATLTGLQNDLARENEESWKAAQADSLKRVSGGVSDPRQSTALDFSDEQRRSTDTVANQRQVSADLSRTQEDSRQRASAAVLSAITAADAARGTDTFKSLSEIAKARMEARTQQAGQTAELLTSLRAKEIEKAQANREFGVAAQEFGLKQQELAAQVAEANRKYRLESRKFKLDRWKARNADAVARAKIELGYDQIAARDGQKAADRALDRWIEKYRANRRSEENAKDRAADRGKKDDKEARTLFRGVQTAKDKAVIKSSKGKDERTIRQELTDAGYDSVTIDVALDLMRNKGRLSARGVRKAKLLGVPKPGKFWDIL